MPPVNSYRNSYIYIFESALPPAPPPRSAARAAVLGPASHACTRAALVVSCVHALIPHPLCLRRSLAFRLREAGVTESAARELARQPAPVPQDPDRAFDAPESA